jgi:hypothetical protein
MGSVDFSEVAKLHATIQDLQRQLQEVKDVQDVQALLNHYAALHDEAFFDLNARAQWENLYTHDGFAKYPFGTHSGREGMGAWAFSGVSFFERCQVLSSNFHTTFSADRRTANVRANVIAQFIKKKEVLDQHFDEGGYYNWVLRKEESGEWKIASVDLILTWTFGEDPSGVGGAKSE